MIRGTSPALADFTFQKLDLGDIVGDRIYYHELSYYICFRI